MRAWAVGVVSLFELALTSLVVPAQAHHASTILVSVDPDGRQMLGGSSEVSISAGGDFVAFVSSGVVSSGGQSKVPQVLNDWDDVFLRDIGSGTTELISVAIDGGTTDGPSFYPSVSADGRFVAYSSWATNLVADDTNRRSDILVRDRLLERTILVSRPPGDQSNGSSEAAKISADGRWVVFSSRATNLVSPAPSYDSIYLADLETGAIELVSVNPAGEPADGPSGVASVSADGRYVAFGSTAKKLDADVLDNNGVQDIFLRDRQERVTQMVSVSRSGDSANRVSYSPDVSDDGNVVMFDSLASNLVAADRNDRGDVFIHDRVAGRTTRVSVSSQGSEAEWNSRAESLSPDGRFVVFTSLAETFVPQDLNNTTDVFIHDRLLGTTALVSVGQTGQQGLLWSSDASVSAHGFAIAFSSEAPNLAPDINPFRDVFVRFPGLHASTCPAGTREEGPVSGPIHDYAEPLIPNLAPQLHDANCNVVTPFGL